MSSGPRPSGKRTELQRRIGQHAADIVCLTETDTARLALPPDGHSICAQANWGQPFRKGQEGRRKVLLWSRECWKAVDAVGHVSLPPGRFVSGVTQTGVGEVTVIGVCIPWSRSRVGTRWNRNTWQDHEEYLAGLAGLLKRAVRTRLVMVGDFNQRIGQRSSTPAPPPRGAPVRPRAEPADRHRGPGLSGAANHRPHRA